MPVKIRLQRRGKKSYPVYSMVVADSRAPRDGKFIEKLGTFNPNLKTKQTVLDVEQAIIWLNKGAQPSDTVRSILSREGVMYKRHLLKGISKGVLTEKEVEEKFSTFIKERDLKEKDIEKRISDKKTQRTEEEKKKAAEKQALLEKEQIAEKLAVTDSEKTPEATEVPAEEKPEPKAESTPAPQDEEEKKSEDE